MQQPINGPNLPLNQPTSEEASVVLARAGANRPPRLSAAKRREPQTVSLDAIQLEIQRIVTQSDSEQSVAQALTEISCRLTNAIWCGYFQQTADGMLQCQAEFNSIADQNLGLATSSLLPTVGSSIRSSKSQVATNEELTVIATPVFADQENPIQSNSCFCVALNLKQESAQSYLLITQIVATALSQWHSRHVNSSIDWQIDSTAAIAELMSKIVVTHGPNKAAIAATNELAVFLGARLVAIGYCQTEGSKRTRLQSVSGTTEIDLGGKQSTLIQAALNETLVRGSVTTLPTAGEDDRSMKLAHQKLIESHNDCRLVSTPLITSEGKTIGAWICLIPDDVDQQDKLIRFSKVTSLFLADALDANKRASAGAVTRLKSQFTQFISGRAGRVGLVAASLLTLLMLVPIPHRINCDCLLQPTVRRFAVAPHDGILLESLVKPGDMVESGQLLARMDDRELRLKLSDLLAQKETALKKRDVSRSARDASATQIAELEIEQINAQVELVNFRKNNLEIRSKVDGIVLQGDLEDAQGAPVRTGDVLVEIAPLEDLKLEISVPESDVSYVMPEQETTIVLDGTPFSSMKEKLESIRPMSEVRENKNVFVSELTISNENGVLRPGMQGRAKIKTGSRSLGWILFHRPAERVYSIFR